MRGCQCCRFEQDLYRPQNPSCSRILLRPFLISTLSSMPHINILSTHRIWQDWKDHTGETDHVTATALFARSYPCEFLNSFQHCSIRYLSTSAFSQIHSPLLQYIQILPNISTWKAKRLLRPNGIWIINRGLYWTNKNNDCSNQKVQEVGMLPVPGTAKIPTHTVFTGSTENTPNCDSCP